MTSSVLLSLAAGLSGLFAEPAPAHQANGIRADPVTLNIGLICQWRRPCIAAQRRAMAKSLKYVAKYDPPEWRIHLCNRNATRSGQRADWIGFDQCIRNESLRPPTLARKTAFRRQRR